MRSSLGDRDAYALATQQEVATFELFEDVQELAKETGDLRCQLVVVSNIGRALGEAGLVQVVQCSYRYQ